MKKRRMNGSPGGAARRSEIISEVLDRANESGSFMDRYK
jgi:hypothetical protein